jgi:hypothetical protein
LCIGGRKLDAIRRLLENARKLLDLDPGITVRIEGKPVYNAKSGKYTIGDERVCVDKTGEVDRLLSDTIIALWSDTKDLPDDVRNEVKKMIWERLLERARNIDKESPETLAASFLRRYDDVKAAGALSSLSSQDELSETVARLKTYRPPHR